MLDSLATAPVRTIVVDNAARRDRGDRRAPRFRRASSARGERRLRSRHQSSPRALSRDDALVLVNDDCVCHPRLRRRARRRTRPADGVVMAAGVLVEAHDRDDDRHRREWSSTTRSSGSTTSTARRSRRSARRRPLRSARAAALRPSTALRSPRSAASTRTCSRTWRTSTSRCGSSAPAAGARSRLGAVGTHEHSATLGSGSSRKNYLMGFGRGYVVRKWSVLDSPGRALRVLASDAVVCARAARARPDARPACAAASPASAPRRACSASRTLQSYSARLRTRGARSADD